MDETPIEIRPFDLSMMQQAIDQARNAAMLGEVPVGAVIVREQKVVATGFNHPIGMHDPTAHAEIRALRTAAELAGNYRLPDCDLYVTLEPCAMCIGAMLHARIRRVYFGAHDPKTGACGSVIDLGRPSRLNHQTRTIGGLKAQECGSLLQEFFAGRREESRRRREDARGRHLGSTAFPARGIEVEFIDDVEADAGGQAKPAIEGSVAGEGTTEGR